MVFADSRPEQADQPVDPSPTRLDWTFPAGWTDVIDNIRRFSHAFESVWQNALSGGWPASTVMALGEASHGLHRVLITLNDSIDETDPI